MKTSGEKKITGNFIKNLDNIKVWSARLFNFLVFPSDEGILKKPEGN